jgi:hypothetical protein
LAATDGSQAEIFKCIKVDFFADKVEKSRRTENKVVFDQIVFDFDKEIFRRNRK